MQIVVLRSWGWEKVGVEYHSLKDNNRYSRDLMPTIVLFVELIERFVGSRRSDH